MPVVRVVHFPIERDFLLSEDRGLMAGVGYKGNFGENVDRSWPGIISNSGDGITSYNK